MPCSPVYCYMRVYMVGLAQLAVRIVLWVDFPAQSMNEMRMTFCCRCFPVDLVDLGIIFPGSCLFSCRPF